MNKENIYNQKSFIDSIAILVIAYVSVARVWLAFASIDYSPVFYYFNQAANYISIVLGTVVIIKYNDSIKINKQIVYLITLSLFYPLSCFFYTANGNNKITALFALFSCIIYILLPNVHKIKIFDVFYRIILITSIISCFLYIIYITGINIGFKEVSFYSSWQNAKYVKWFVFAIFKNSSELRLCGIFNEPGALGTVCSLLFITRYTHMKKWEKFAMLLTVALTFSLFGFILIFTFYSIKVIFKNPRNFIFIFLFIAIFLLLPYIDFGNQYVYNFFDRISITENGLAGDNRIKEWFDKSFEEFMKTDDKWFGKKEGYTFTNGIVGISSYKNYIVQYGIVGFGIWVFLWAFNSFQYLKLNKKCFLPIIFFLISIYQRPLTITSLYGYVMLFGGLEWLNLQTTNKQKILIK